MKDSSSSKEAYEVEMDPWERDVYDEMKKDLVLMLPDRAVTAANAAVLTGKLLQLSGGAIYDDAGKVNHIHDRKLDALEDIVESMNGRPLLVAYWFRHDYERIVLRLKKMGVNFEKLDSDESMRRWNAGEIQVGLAHPTRCHPERSERSSPAAAASAPADTAP